MANPHPPSLADLATYVAETCAELRAVVRAPELRTLDYLLDMTRIEAERYARDFRERDRRDAART